MGIKWVLQLLTVGVSLPSKLPSWGSVQSRQLDEGVPRDKQSVLHSQTRLTHPAGSSFPALYNPQTRQEELWGTDGSMSDRCYLEAFVIKKYN